MSYFLGIDAGATRTQCALAKDANVLARVQGGSIKITRVGAAAAQKNLDDMLSAAASQSGVALHSLAGTCVGLSGIAIPSVADWVSKALASRVHGPIALCGDEEIALDAAFHGGRGILVIAGTGSHVGGRTGAGQLFRTGGWGPVLSDQGAGSRIGLLALRAIFYAIDASETTSLLHAVHAAWGTRTIEDLVDLGNHSPRPGFSNPDSSGTGFSSPDFSRLAPLVAKCAADGDPVAARVLRQSGEELGDLVVLAMRKGAALEAKGPSNTLPPAWSITYTGSVIEKIPAMRDVMVAAIHREQPAAAVLSHPADPVLGALWRARQCVSIA